MSKAELIQIARREASDQLRALLPGVLRKVKLVSIPSAAGLLGIRPDKARRIFRKRKRIVSFGPRSARVSLEDIEEVKKERTIK